MIISHRKHGYHRYFLPVRLIVLKARRKSRNCRKACTAHDNLTQKARISQIVIKPVRLLKSRRKCRDSRKACTARTERLQTEEGLELVLFVENPDSGAKEDEEDKDENTFATGGTSLLHRYCGTLKSGESRGVFLNLGFGSL